MALENVLERLHEKPVLVEDQLSFVEEAVSLADDIIQSKNTPFVFAIWGDWGSGKTSFMHILRSLLDERHHEEALDVLAGEKRKALNGSDPYGIRKKDRLYRRKTNDIVSRPCKTIWFRAWEEEFRQDGDGKVWESLFGQIIREIHTDGLIRTELKKQPSNARLFESLYQAGQSFLRSYNSRPDWKAATFHGVMEFIKRFFMAGPSERTSIPAIDKGASLQRFRDTFETVTRSEAFPYEKIVVFIDDLDRCDPKNAFDIVKSLKAFFETDKLVFVFWVERRMLERWFEMQRAEMFGDTLRNDVTFDRYMQKIVSRDFDIGATYLRRVSGGTYGDVSPLLRFVRELSKEIVTELVRNCQKYRSDLSEEEFYRAYGTLEEQSDKIVPILTDAFSRWSRYNMRNCKRMMLDLVTQLRSSDRLLDWLCDMTGTKTTTCLRRDMLSSIVAFSILRNDSRHPEWYKQFRSQYLWICQTLDFAQTNDSDNDYLRNSFAELFRIPKESPEYLQEERDLDLNHLCILFSELRLARYSDLVASGFRDFSNEEITPEMLWKFRFRAICENADEISIEELCCAILDEEHAIRNNANGVDREMGFPITRTCLHRFRNDPSLCSPDGKTRNAFNAALASRDFCGNTFNSYELINRITDMYVRLSQYDVSALDENAFSPLPLRLLSYYAYGEFPRTNYFRWSKLTSAQSLRVFGESVLTHFALSFHPDDAVFETASARIAAASEWLQSTIHKAALSNDEKLVLPAVLRFMDYAIETSGTGPNAQRLQAMRQAFSRPLEGSISALPSELAETAPMDLLDLVFPSELLPGGKGHSKFSGQYAELLRHLGHAYDASFVISHAFGHRVSNGTKIPPFNLAYVLAFQMKARMDSSIYFSIDALSWFGCLDGVLKHLDKSLSEEVRWWLIYHGFWKKDQE